jgi:hypothetical protein
MRAFKLALVFAALGVVAGYLVFARDAGRLIPLDALFATGFAGMIMDMAGRQAVINKIVLSGVAAFVLGLVIGHRTSREDGERVSGAALNRTPNPQTQKHAHDLAQLEKLADLKERGILTEDEFAAKKKQILEP